MKRALVIGIDDYPEARLSSCVKDAKAIGDALQRNEGGALNMTVTRLVSDEQIVDGATLNNEIERTLVGDAELVVLYFAGHGILNRETGAGFLVAQDGRRGAWGMSMGDLMGFVNRGYPHIKSTVVILDCCHSGYLGEVAAVGKQEVSEIGSGVTIMSASHRDRPAHESPDHGLFTELLLDGLAGGAADILGNITPAALYAHVDRSLGPKGERPIYKANVQTFVNLRQVKPRVMPEFLRELPSLFPDENGQLRLTPAYEPSRAPLPQALIDAPPNPELNRVFRGLQACNRMGLVVPEGEEHMYDAAVNSKGCRLTALGRHYRALAEQNYF